jgi:hypothetical protein
VYYMGKIWEFQHLSVYINNSVQTVTLHCHHGWVTLTWHTISCYILTTVFVKLRKVINSDHNRSIFIGKVHLQYLLYILDKEWSQWKFSRHACYMERWDKLFKWHWIIEWPNVRDRPLLLISVSKGSSIDLQRIKMYELEGPHHEDMNYC